MVEELDETARAVSKFKKLADFWLVFDCGSEQVLIIMSSLIFVWHVT